jgi:hypothetical protein
MAQTIREVIITIINLICSVMVFFRVVHVGSLQWRSKEFRQGDEPSLDVKVEDVELV